MRSRLFSPLICCFANGVKKASTGTQAAYRHAIRLFIERERRRGAARSHLLQALGKNVSVQQRLVAQAVLQVRQQIAIVAGRPQFPHELQHLM